MYEAPQGSAFFIKGVQNSEGGAKLLSEGVHLWEQL
jgi:hypothetical protein